MRFIGRTQELACLEDLYAEKSFQFVTLYGRRRVGKTTLLNHFQQGKRAIHVLCSEYGADSLLTDLSRAISDFQTGDLGTLQFKTFESAFEFIFSLAKKERLLFIIDEYPYLARAMPGVQPLLQSLIDRHKGTSHLMLILSGSYISFMEDEVLAYKAPLYGRCTQKIRLQPLKFTGILKWFDHYSNEDAALTYGVLDGTPLYLERFAPELPFEDNLKRNFLTMNCFFSDEPYTLLRQELLRPQAYHEIFFAIARGASRLNEIATAIQHPASATSLMLNTLVELGLLRKESPYLEERSRRSIYRINDLMFRFHFSQIRPLNSLIANGASERCYSILATHLSTYMGEVFERICTQYLWQMLLEDRAPVNFMSLGRWWGNSPLEKSQVEIDIMGEESSHKALYAECKWRESPVDIDVLNTLKSRSMLFAHTEKRYVLFAKRGFTQRCEEAAASDKNITLVTFDEICRNLKGLQK